ncbi:MAG TPA: phosphotriesterase-related protein [candidate division Zixibacteria bacterium]|nr:phosphotriesterase-related protein [candidate division Zixibacteria bacterium]
MAPRVMTVGGPIPPERIGLTLPHEHSSCSPEVARSRAELVDYDTDFELMVGELRDFRRRGGSCLVDLTNHGLGRDPLRLRTLSTTTNLYIVMGAGWYRERCYPAAADIDRRTVDDLADEIVAEFRDGVDGTGVRPGIIGEIGTDAAWVSPREERVHRAVARAARETGLGIVTHSLHSRVGLEQLRIFEEEGADLSRVVIGHADSVPDLDYHLAIIERGANLCFDQLGGSGDYHAAREAQLVQIILELLERGFADRIFLSTDTCRNQQLRAFGGPGFSYVPQHFLPTLRTAAVGEGEIRQMTVDNPRRLLTIP